MVDPWTHAVRLDQAVKRDGVAQARVALEDYEGAKELVRAMWKGERWPNPRERIRSRGEEVIPARVLLGYLRGYFLYREIPENDQAFWPHFLKDLGLKERRLPSQEEYDRLWDVLSWHEETCPHLRFQSGGGRDFVGTLDGIFHFRALRLAALKSAFLEYREKGWVPDEARTYERILQRLNDAVELLLSDEEPPNLEDQEAVLAYLQEAGLHLGEPNPVRLLFHRSRGVLRNLYQQLKGTPPRRRQFRHRQVKVEVVSAPRELSEVQPTLDPEPLVEGWRVHGKVVLEDGRFRRFSWIPRYSPEGVPLPEEVAVKFPEGEEVRFRLHHKAFALRFSVSRWRLGESLGLQPLGFDPERHPLRFYLASGGKAVQAPEELQPDPDALEELLGESLLQDELMVEVRLDGRNETWRLLARLPVEVRPGLEAWVSREGLYARTQPPGFPVRVRIWAGDKPIRDGLVRADGRLVAVRTLVPLRVEVHLGGESQIFHMEPKGWLKGWWRLGLGLSRTWEVRTGNK